VSERGRLPVLAAEAVGLAAQIAGLALAASSALDEASVAVGALFILVGTVALMGGLEARAASKGRSGAWSLLALAGPAGPVVVRLLDEGDAPPPPGAAEPAAGSAADRVAGVALTVLVTVFLVWSAARWLGWGDRPAEPGPAEIPRNEELALGRLGLIARAQEEFRRTDWDGDGERSYALFVVHLWQTVDGDVRPVRTDLVPKELAFAMGSSGAVDGYCYVDLYQLELPPADGERDRVRELRPAAEWAVAATPEVHGRTGVFTMIADQSGRVFARDLAGVRPKAYPHAPASQGWRLIGSAGDLAKLRKAGGLAR